MTFLESLVFVLCVLALVEVGALVRMLGVLRVLAENQVAMNRQAEAGLERTAEALTAADAGRQTHDERSGEDVVNTRVRKEP